MKRKNKPTDTYLSEHGFTTFDGNKKTFNVYEGHSLRFLYSEEFISKGYDEVRLIKKDRTCPECGCNSVKNGSYGINLNKNQEIRIEGYKCNNCENTHYFYASQYADVDKGCTYDCEL